MSGTTETLATTPAAERKEALKRIGERLLDARCVVLTTHVNADGDGTGSEIALASWLKRRGVPVTIINPTRYPNGLTFLLSTKGAGKDLVSELGSDPASRTLQECDLFAVLDTGEKNRIGKIARAIDGRDAVVIDHHPPGDDQVPGQAVRAPEACATGELIYDLFLAMDETEEWSDAMLQGLYTAIVTDTGSFRFSNTTPRTHEIVGDLIRRGIDPEAMYRRLYSVPHRRVMLLREALHTLEIDADYGISWMTVPAHAIQRLKAKGEDLDGLIEHARSIRGTRVAMLFRQTAGSTKVSFRSTGEVDVNAIARHFGGGGHVKAAGALIGGRLEINRGEVVDYVRRTIGRASGRDV